MRQLPLFVVLLFSGGILLWNLTSYRDGDAALVHRHGEVTASDSDVEVALHRPETVEEFSTEDAAPASGSFTELRLSPDWSAPSSYPERSVVRPSGGGDAGQQDADPAPLKQFVRERAPSGFVRAEGLVVDGQREGSWVEWWRDGVRFSEGSYVGGERQGHWTFWHENGNVSEEGSFVADLQDGYWRWRYPSGDLKTIARFDQGIKDGSWSEWSEEGTCLREGHYVDGEPEGRWIDSHLDGTLRSETHYHRGLREGAHRAWYTDGSLREQGDFRAGLKEGRWVFFDRRGQPDRRRTGYYERGVLRRP